MKILSFLSLFLFGIDISRKKFLFFHSRLCKYRGSISTLISCRIIASKRVKFPIAQRYQRDANRGQYRGNEIEGLKKKNLVAKHR